MTHRIAITVAGVVATIILAFGLAAAGFGPQSAPRSTTEAVDLVVDPVIQDSTPAEAGREFETVYVQPAPRPRTVVVRRSAETSSRASDPTLRALRGVRYDPDDEDPYERDERGDREDDGHEDRGDDD